MQQRKRLRFVLILGLAVAASPACESMDPGLLGNVLAGMGGGTQLDEGTVVAGLKEALRVGTQNTVSSTSSPDGFFGNPVIRIPVPDQLDTMAQGLRRVGFGSQVDEFELAMNRAAEDAAGEALDVFVGAISQMSFSDARGILDGGETAATEFFRRTTSDQLRGRFSPIVDQSMRQVGLVQVYDQLLSRWRQVPLVPQPQFDLNRYVTDQGLGGLFHVLGEEEKKIRTDPAARVTDLLKTVFGSR
jgi:hypothetical protein